MALNIVADGGCFSPLLDTACSGPLDCRTRLRDAFHHTFGHPSDNFAGPSAPLSRPLRSSFVVSFFAAVPVALAIVVVYDLLKRKGA